MLAKKFRLKSKEVSGILEKGITKKTKFFIVRLQSSEEESNKFGTVISRKFHKQAVKRNKVKRRIHEAIRNNLEKLDNQTTVEIVLIPKKICLDKDYHEIKEDIIYTLEHAKQWVKI